MYAMPAPLPPDDEHNGRRVYGPVFDLSERPGKKNTNGIIRILVQSRRIKDDDGNLWPESRIRESALAYLNQLLTGSTDAPIDRELEAGRVRDGRRSCSIDSLCSRSTHTARVHLRVPGVDVGVQLRVDARYQGRDVLL